jgi:hypothetical protein
LSNPSIATLKMVVGQGSPNPATSNGSLRKARAIAG